MVEYKKKKIILQSSGVRNFYYKVTANGKKKQVSKKVYLEKKGGEGNENIWVPPPIISMNNLEAEEEEKIKQRGNKIRMFSKDEEEFLSKCNKNNPNDVKLLKYLRNRFEKYAINDQLSNSYIKDNLLKYNNYPEYKRKKNELEKKLSFFNVTPKLNIKPIETAKPIQQKTQIKPYEFSNTAMQNYQMSIPMRPTNKISSKQRKKIEREKQDERKGQENLLNNENARKERAIEQKRKEKEKMNYIRNRRKKIQQEYREKVYIPKKEDISQKTGITVNDLEFPDVFIPKFEKFIENKNNIQKNNLLKDMLSYCYIWKINQENENEQLGIEYISLDLLNPIDKFQDKYQKYKIDYNKPHPRYI
jgi:hypothetical protein